MDSSVDGKYETPLFSNVVDDSDVKLRYACVNGHAFFKLFNV